MRQGEQEFVQELEVVSVVDPLQLCREKLNEAVNAARKMGQDTTSLDRHISGRVLDASLAANAINAVNVITALTDVKPLNNPEILTLAMMVALGALVRDTIRSRRVYKSPVETPLQSRISVLQARVPFGSIQPKDTVLDFQSGVLPPETKIEKTIQAKQRQLLELRDLSASTDYDHLILPTTLVGKVPAVTGTLQTHQDVIATITGCALEKPDITNVSLWTKEEFETYASTIEITKDGSLLRTIIAELTKKISNPYAEAYLEDRTPLSAASPYISRYLKSVLIRGLDDELDKAKRVRPQENDGTIATKQHLTNRLLEIDGELRVNQYDENQHLVTQENVARLAAISEHIGDAAFWRKFYAGQYSTVQLSYLAINLIKQARTEPQTPTETTDAPEAPEMSLPPFLSIGPLQNPEVIRRERRQTLKRRLGAVLMTLAIAKGGGMLFHNMPQPTGGRARVEALQPTLENMDSRDIGESQNSDLTEWQLTDRGISTDGYYHTRSYNTFNGKTGWATTRQTHLLTELPNNDAQPDTVARLTIKSLQTGDQLKIGKWLPIKEGTYLSTVRVVSIGTNPHFQRIPIYTDGTGLMMQLPEAVENAFYVVEADFTGGSHTITDYQKGPITSSTSNTMQQLGYINSITQESVERFQYDNTKALHKITDHVTDGQSLIAGVDKAGICNCNLCASRVALMAQSQSIPAEYVSGYINSGDGVVSDDDIRYLNAKERHGWVEYAGSWFDPTPHQMTEAEAKTREASAHAEYNPVPHKHNFEKQFMLASMASLFAYGGWKTSKVLIPRVRQNYEQRWLESDHTRHSYDYLNWVVYGNPDIPPSKSAERVTKSTTELRDSIRTDFNPKDLQDYVDNQPWRYDNKARLSYRQLFQARRLARKIIRTSA